MYRWIGAALIVAGCGGWGLSMASSQLHEEAMLKELLFFLESVRWELEYRMTSLPELIQTCSQKTHGQLRRTLLQFEENLRNLALPDAGCCMSLALSEEMPSSIRRLLDILGDSLGRYDLSGQLEGLQAVESACRSRGEELKLKRNDKLHSFRILGFCAGIALVVLLV